MIKSVFGLIASFLILSSMTGRAISGPMNNKVTCADFEKQNVQIAGLWSNWKSNGEHESGYNVTLLKVGNNYVGSIENMAGLIGDGGILNEMVRIKYTPGKSLLFGAFLEGSEDPTTPWAYSLDIQKHRAILKVDQYRSETLDQMKSEESDRIITNFKKIVLKCE